MKDKLIKDVIASLPRERTLYYYFKDRYALMLLSKFIGDGLPLRQIKQSGFSRLLDRPLLKSIIAEKGDGKLSSHDLSNCWPVDPVCYRLTLGQWGKEKGAAYGQQTTRDQPNLVLQLNFSNQHDQAYSSLIGPQDYRPFVYESHPVARAGFNTLAWARIDLDFETGEALIEELQTDWLRYVKWFNRATARGLDEGGFIDGDEIIEYREIKIRRRDFNAYVTDVIAPHMKLWDEALMSAAIWFLSEELGIRNIYFHQADCSARLKQIRDKLPPRSLYTDLPKKFCFQEVSHAPDFLYEKPSRTFKILKKENKLRFWQLELGD